MLLLAALAAAGSATASNKGRLNLPSATIPLGASYTITGRTGAPDGKSRATGNVLLTGRLNGGSWLFLVRTHTRRDGSYRLSIKPTKRGRLELRLVTPDHGVTRVVVTIV